MKLGRDVVTALAEYGVNVSLDEPPIVGPTFLRFPITLGRGTRVHAVERHAAELQEPRNCSVTAICCSRTLDLRAACRLHCCRPTSETRSSEDSEIVASRGP